MKEDKVKVSFFVDKSSLKKKAFSQSSSEEEYNELKGIIEMTDDVVAHPDDDKTMPLEMAKMEMIEIAMDAVVASNPDCIRSKERSKFENGTLSKLLSALFDRSSKKGGE